MVENLAVYGAKAGNAPIGAEHFSFCHHKRIAPLGSTSMEPKGRQAALPGTADGQAANGGWLRTLWVDDGIGAILSDVGHPRAPISDTAACPCGSKRDIRIALVRLLSLAVDTGLPEWARFVSAISYPFD